MGSYDLPKSHSKSTTEPQYEGCGEGVTNSDVAMEGNPAYQSMAVAVAKPWAVDSKLYRDTTVHVWRQRLMLSTVNKCVLCYLVCLHIGDCVCALVCKCVCFWIYPISTTPVTLSQQYNSVSEGLCVMTALHACTILYDVLDSDDIEIQWYWDVIRSVTTCWVAVVHCLVNARWTETVRQHCV